jgi:membrane associated rhomboid family serine protease/Zn-finger nucleic acid-binding protein
LADLDSKTLPSMIERMAMDCPYCQTELRTYSNHHFTIDYCPACQGLWFDPGEMRDYIRVFLQNNPNLEKDKINLRQTVARIDSLPEFSRSCPRCRVPMGKVNYSYDSNVIIDQCPKCCGVWVDRGEIQQIIRYIKQNQSTLEFTPEALERAKKDGLLIEIADVVDTIMLKPHLILALLTGTALPVADVRTQNFPYGTAGIIGLNVLIFLYQVIFIRNSSSFFHSFGFIPAEVASGAKGYTIITSMFIHASSLHLLGNMIFLWVFGDNVEDSLGLAKYLVSYLIFGMFAGFTHYLLKSGLQIPAVGASGAISGILGAYLILFPRKKLTVKLKYSLVDLPVWFYLGTWTVFQVFHVLFFASPGFSTGTAWLAHSGGFLAGILMMIWHKQDQVQAKKNMVNCRRNH